MPESHRALASPLLEEASPRYYQIHARCTGKVLALLSLSVGLGFAVVLTCMGGQQLTAEKSITTVALPNMQPVRARGFLQFKTKQPNPWPFRPVAVSPLRSMKPVSAGAGDKPCSGPGCTCGPNCKCGDNCQCAGCPGSKGGGISDDVRMGDELWQDLGGLRARAQYSPQTASSQTYVNEPVPFEPSA